RRASSDAGLVGVNPCRPGWNSVRLSTASRSRAARGSEEAEMPSCCAAVSIERCSAIAISARTCVVVILARTDLKDLSSANGGPTSGATRPSSISLSILLVGAGYVGPYSLKKQPDGARHSLKHTQMSEIRQLAYFRQLAYLGHACLPGPRVRSIFLKSGFLRSGPK